MTELDEGSSCEPVTRGLCGKHTSQMLHGVVYFLEPILSAIPSPHSAPAIVGMEL